MHTKPTAAAQRAAGQCTLLGTAKPSLAARLGPQRLNRVHGAVLCYQVKWGSQSCCRPCCATPGAGAAERTTAESDSAVHSLPHSPLSHPLCSVLSWQNTARSPWVSLSPDKNLPGLASCRCEHNRHTLACLLPPTDTRCGPGRMSHAGRQPAGWWRAFGSSICYLCKNNKISLCCPQGPLAAPVERLRG